MSVNRENIQTWVDALRSGEYSQTTGTLRSSGYYDPKSGPAYCCLGVACDVSGLGEWSTEMDHDGEYLSNGGFLPSLVVNHFGLDEIDGWDPPVPLEVARRFAPEATKRATESWCGVISLSTLNDNGATFLQIADIIEAVFLGNEEG